MTVNGVCGAHVVRRGDGFQGEIGEKLTWQGRLIFVQPRIRLLRSYDRRSHSYIGYVLCVRGSIADRGGVVPENSTILSERERIKRETLEGGKEQNLKTVAA